MVTVFAVSINSWDWEILIGKPFVNRLMAGLLKPKRIKILGCDIAGRVDAVGKNVKQFQLVMTCLGTYPGVVGAVSPSMYLLVKKHWR